jgi:hypothetical protein
VFCPQIPIAAWPAAHRPRKLGPHAAPGGVDGRSKHMLRKLRATYRRDDGMTTAEYAVGIIAAVAFAGILYKVLTSTTVVTALTAIVKRALAQG